MAAASPTTYTLSLHDALPIFERLLRLLQEQDAQHLRAALQRSGVGSGVLLQDRHRSEEHTSELQSPVHLVCRLLLEKKKRPRNPWTPRGLNRRTPSAAPPPTA